jgi:ferritin-like metal-binding protein YciE
MAKQQKDLRELFHDTLKDIYFAEKKILTALPKMAKAAHSEELQKAFQKHESETEDHVERLDKYLPSWTRRPAARLAMPLWALSRRGRR